MGMYYPCRGRDIIDAYANVDYEVWKKSERAISRELRLNI
jgi:hypothetical protein